MADVRLDFFFSLQLGCEAGKIKKAGNNYTVFLQWKKNEAM